MIKYPQIIGLVSAQDRFRMQLFFIELKFNTSISVTCSLTRYNRHLLYSRASFNTMKNPFLRIHIILYLKLKLVQHICIFALK